MNSSTSEVQATPESESFLSAQAELQSEAILTLYAGTLPLYVLERRLRTQTAQSDYFKVQLRAHSARQGLNWMAADEDETRWQDTRNSAHVCVDHPSASISFGPRGGIPTSEALTGRGVPTYLFAQTILWAKAHYPDYRVKGGLLHPDEASNEEAKLRRNSFYAAQGFDFEWFDAERRTGRFFKPRVSQLLGSWDKDAVHAINPEHLLETLAQQDATRAEIESRLSQLASNKEYLAVRFERERMLNLILTGVTCFVLVMGLMAALGV